MSDFNPHPLKWDISDPNSWVRRRSRKWLRHNLDVVAVFVFAIIVAMGFYNLITQMRPN